MLRSLRLALLASTLFVVPAKADPIFTPLAMFAFNAGLGVTVTNAILGIGVLGSVFSAVGTLALTVGANYIVSLLNRPQQPKPSDGQVEIRQAVPERRWHYGRVKVSGPLAFYESRGGVLYKAILLSSREIDAYELFYLDDRPITSLLADGSVATKPYYDSDPLTYHVHIYQHLGIAGQVPDNALRQAFVEWTADHRLDGQAYCVMTCETTPQETFQNRYPNGEPSFAVLLRGAKLYDPRDGQTRWSENAALAVLDYLTHPDGYARSLAKLDLDSFRAMADLCDEPVPLAAGGTEPRYRVATTVKLTEQRKAVLARLLEACNATLYPTQDGKIAIRGGRWTEPTVTIDADEGHILETNFAPPDAMSRYNELAIQYLDPALAYVENDGTPWLDAADYEQTGTLITAPLDLVQVPSHAQARRLAKIRMARDNCDWVGEIVTNLAGLNAIGETVIRLRWPELDIDGPYWVEGGAELLPGMTGVRLKLRSANAASYDWTTAEEGTSTSIPPDTSPEMDLSPPDLTLTEGTGPVIIATWTPSAALNRVYEVRYRQDGFTTYTAMTVASTRDQATSGEVEPGRTYHVQIRQSAGPQAVGPWSSDYTIVIEEVTP